MHNRLLIAESPLVVLPTLATAIGLHEAIVLQQVQYWINTKNKSRERYQDAFVAGSDGLQRCWIFNSITSWQKQFPFWNERTLRRVIEKLVSDNLLICEQLSTKKWDRTNWYTINYTRLGEILAEIDGNAMLQENDTDSSSDSQPEVVNALGQKSHIDEPNMSQCRVRGLTVLPETTTENIYSNSADAVAKDIPEATEQKKNSRFTPPSEQEVLDAFTAKGRADLADGFYGYWESGNWYRGRTRIVNWKACVSTWIANNKTPDPNQPPRSAPPPKPVYELIFDETTKNFVKQRVKPEPLPDTKEN